MRIRSADHLRTSSPKESSSGAASRRWIASRALSRLSRRSSGSPREAELVRIEDALREGLLEVAQRHIRVFGDLAKALDPARDLSLLLFELAAEFGETIAEPFG